MIRSNCDHCEGAHERILRKLVETNLEQTPGCGEGHYYTKTTGIIRNPCNQEDVAVHFPVGNTQVNMTVIVSTLCSHQGVVDVVTAYINVHEAGSVEAIGHRVLALSSEDGKITAEQAEGLYQAHIRGESFEHTVQPRMVYISNPMGPDTIYTRSELKDPYEVYREYGLYLSVDGARLAYGLTAERNDLDLKSLAVVCDIFCIGGTKAEAFLGEAAVILDDELKADFRYYTKQRGGMLAEGRLLDIQFGEFLRDGLYFELGAHADGLAGKIRCTCTKKGYPSLVEDTTSQAFLITPDSLLESWKDKYSYTNQGRVDESHTVIRLCTSQITSGGQMNILVNDILNS